MHKILIIEDDLVIANTLKSHLSHWNYEVEYVTGFKEVMTHFNQMDPQLVLMDINLPFFNGYYWCTEIRKVSKVPIIFISSAGENMNVVMAINMGGDDFIIKPFDLDVLTAKVQALLRRAYSFQGQVNIIEYNGVLLNLNDTSLTFQKRKIDLTKNDFKILQVLMENIGKVISRDILMMKLWESDNFIDDNTLTVNITRIRKKLDDIGLTEFIVTKKGIGYMVV